METLPAAIKGTEKVRRDERRLSDLFNSMGLAIDSAALNMHYLSRTPKAVQGSSGLPLLVQPEYTGSGGKVASTWAGKGGMGPSQRAYCLVPCPTKGSGCPAETWG